MVTYSPGDVVRVPFPFVDSGASKHRPALIISNAKYNSVHGHCIMTMITSAKHSRWSSDVDVNDLDAAGLSSPSIVRFKLFTIDSRLINKLVGKMGSEDWNDVIKMLGNILPAQPAS